ncbi:MAG: pilus assembly protein PilM [bacterium]|nr:pilus assembly protein PilM [bacterium]
MRQGLLNALFPLPRYLKMPSVGLDISDKSIRFIGFKEKKGALRIDRFAEEKLPTGIVVRGKIKDPEKMKEELTRFREAHGLEFVRVSLPEEQAYLFSMRLPLVKKRELKESVTLQLEEHVPLKPEDAVFDYEISGERADGYSLGVSVYPRTVAESYANIFIGSGLIPLSFEIEAEAIARAVVPKGDHSTYMVVDFGQMRTGISVVSGGAVAFTSTVEIGGAEITEAIAAALNISRTEAETMKREKGLVRGEGGKEKAYASMLSIVAPLRDEINKHYLYWHTHQEGETARLPIAKLILCGGDSNLRGLPEYLSRSMRVPVELSNVWVNVGRTDEYLPEIAFGDSLTYATAIGLALADFIE